MSNYRGFYAPGYRPGGGYRLGAYGDGSVTTTTTLPLPGLAALEFLHDAQNIDLTSNSSLVDGQALGTVKNAGVRGTLGDVLQATAGNKPAFKKIAALGKLNNLSSINCVDAVRQMGSGAFTTIPQPFQVAFVWRTDKTTTQIVTTGLPTTPQIYTTAAAGNLQVNAGAGAQDTGLAVSANAFHMAVITLNGASSVARVDGVASSAFNAGSTGFTSILVLLSSNSPSGVLGLIGDLVIQGVWSTPQDPLAIEASFVSRYGTFPQ